MRKSARFAASSLSFLVALTALGADLRTASDPATIDAVFPKAAKLRVLNVWATWCAPCVAEMPDLRKVDETFGAEVAIAGVSMDDMIPDTKAADVAKFLDKQRIAFPNVYYTGNADALANQLKITGELPVTIVYDASGRELWRHEGRIELEPTIARLRELLRRTR